MNENHALISCDISCFTFHRIQQDIFFSSIVCNVLSRFSKAIDGLSKRIQQSFCSWTFVTMNDLLNASSKLKYFVRIILFFFFSLLFFIASFPWRARYGGGMKRHTKRECKSITHANLSALLIGWSSWAASWTWICTFGSTKYFQQKEKERKKKKRERTKNMVLFDIFRKLHLLRHYIFTPSRKSPKGLKLFEIL